MTGNLFSFPREGFTKKSRKKCGDHNFGNFDDFGVKNDQKVSHNMILMTKYKGQLHGEKVSTNLGRGPPNATLYCFFC